MQPDYVGLKVETKPEDYVGVQFAEVAAQMTEEIQELGPSPLRGNLLKESLSTEV